MAREDAEKFLSSIANNPAEREKLQSALSGDIVKAAQQAGYSVTEQDVSDILARLIPGSGNASGDESGILGGGTSIGWS